MPDHTRAHQQLQFEFPTTRVCTKCGMEKPLDDFARSKLGRYGRQSQCKECKKEMKRAWHLANRESENAKSRAYQEQNRADRLTKSRAKYREEREKMINAARQRHEGKPEKSRDAARNYRKKYPGRHVANSTVHRWVDAGKLPPASTMVCEDCQEALAAHWHHHKGYAKEHWLDVIALCTDCHGKAHWVDE